MLWPEDPFKNLELIEDGQALIQPEVLPSVVRDQVSAPRVRNLMCHHRHLRTIAGEQCRRNKGDTWVLHPTIRKRRRQNKQVVDAPFVRAADLLPCLQELLRVGELVRCCVDHLLLAPHAAPGADLPAHQGSAHDRNQVAGHRHLLIEVPESPLAAASGSVLAHSRRRVLQLRRLVAPHGAHQRHQLCRAADGSAVGHLGLARVLTRDQRARVDGLALREEIWVPLSFCLVCVQPLQCAATVVPTLRCLRGIVNAHNHLRTLLATRQGDAQGRTQHSMRSTEGEGARDSTASDSRNHFATSIKNELAAVTGAVALRGHQDEAM
mmetsp:Transcript_30454/g.83976  ORF Transcript_30454/g.83976 Transcript_30454/m.83976 type:complete len:323 (+) Transcript_30454:849-1817(+)